MSSTDINDLLSRLADREREKERRANMREQIIKEQYEGTPRFLRAMRFSNQIMGLVRDFVPQDRECCSRLEDILLEAGFDANAEIINVPPECDHLDKKALEARRLELSMQRIQMTDKPSERTS